MPATIATCCGWDYPGCCEANTLCTDCAAPITTDQFRDNGLCADCNRQQGTMPQPGRE